LPLQEASLKALSREGSPPEAQPSVAPLSRAVLQWGLRPASPASAWRLAAAVRLAQALRARLLPPVVASVPGVPAVPRSGEAAAVAGSRGLAAPRAEERAAVSGAVAEPRQAEAAVAESDAVVQPREVAVAESDAVVQPREVAAAELDAAAEPQPAAAAWDAEAEPQRAVAQVAGSDVAEPRRAARVAPVASVRQPVAGPSAVPWVVRRGRLLPWPARRRAARFAHAMRMSRAASLSERSRQAARGEGLS
jgi:hypothetical protein